MINGKIRLRDDGMSESKSCAKPCDGWGNHHSNIN